MQDIKILKKNIRSLERKIKPLRVELQQLHDELSILTDFEKISELKEKYIGKFWQMTDDEETLYCYITDVLNKNTLLVNGFCFLNENSKTSSFYIAHEKFISSYYIKDLIHIELTKEQFLNKLEQFKNEFVKIII